jgi:hypothetical protein
MKLGIPLLVLGVALLLLSIPLSILGIIAGTTRIQGNILEGLPPYLGVVGVIIGFVLTTIGAVRVFKN